MAERNYAKIISDADCNVVGNQQPPHENFLMNPGGSVCNVTRIKRNKAMLANGPESDGSNQVHNVLLPACLACGYLSEHFAGRGAKISAIPETFRSK